MAIIKKMDLKLADMIAAGEVVDRPASVIKELVENSIDANASIIDVFVYDLGLKEITVVDNGIGMDLIDAKLAFSRHATSKIYQEKDLNSINTLGFRGEALAAISSVSKIMLKTKTNSTDAIMLSLDNGQFSEIKNTAFNTGTQITVTDLFYNTPARFKYIKSETAEKNAIIDTFNNLVLANPNIRFSLTIDDKLYKKTYGTSNPIDVVSEIYGHEIAKNMTVLDTTIQKIKVKCLLGSPKDTRSRKKDILIFINGRYIKNYKLTEAIIDGYQGFLMVNRYPIALVYLTISPNLVDFNCHPQKLEVKILNELLISYQLTEIVKNTLNKTPQRLNSTLVNTKETFTKEKLDFVIEETFNNHIEESINLDSDKKIPDFDYIGTLAGTYLLFSNNEGLYLIDQHAAMERVRYEYYQQSFKNPVVALKESLFPREINLPKNDIDTLIKNKDYLETLKFIFDDDDKLIGKPTFIKDQEIELALETIAYMLEEKKTVDLVKLKDTLIKDLSCKGSIKANQRLNKNEIDKLILDLKKTKNPYHCPHGRPTIILLSYYEIEKLFKRVV